MTWEVFLETLLLRLHELHRQQVKADVVILLGRKDPTTKTPLPPKFKVRLLGEDRWEEG